LVPRSRDALERQQTRAEATEALRGLVDAIILTPTNGEFNRTEGKSRGTARGDGTKQEGAAGWVRILPRS